MNTPKSPGVFIVSRLGGCFAGSTHFDDDCELDFFMGGSIPFIVPTRPISTALDQLTISFPKHSAMLSPDEIYEGVDQKMLSSLSEDEG